LSNFDLKIEIFDDFRFVILNFKINFFTLTQMNITLTQKIYFELKNQKVLILLIFLNF